MIRFAVVMVAIAGVALTAGCTVKQLKAGVYEGLRANNNLQSSPSERMGKPDAPDYHQYEQMRKEKSP